MLKKHKNELFQIIQNEGIPLNLIKKTEEVIGDHPAVVIGIIGTPFNFIVRHSTENYDWFDCNYVKFNPDFSDTGYLPGADEYFSFINIKSLFTDWLQSHVKEYFNDIAEPDLWDQLSTESAVLNLNIIDFDDKEFFSTDEKQQIRLALSDVRLLIDKAFNPSPAESESIAARLDYLMAAVDRLNKFDWKSLLISTIMSISIALSFDPEKGKQLFNLFKQVFNVIPKLFH